MPIIDLENKIREKENSVDLKLAKAEINFENVNFKYNKELALAKFDKSFEKLEGKTKTAVLFSGAELSGSGLRIMRQNAEEAELEREIIAYDFNIEKQRKFEEANFARMGGTIARNQARSAELGYYAQAGTSLLRGFG